MVGMAQHFKVLIVTVLKDLFENKFYYYILLTVLKNSSNVTHFHDLVLNYTGYSRQGKLNIVNRFMSYLVK